MIVDVNLLLHGVDTSSRHHAAARQFLEERLNGEPRVGLPWQCLGAFIRIATHPRIMSNPLRSAEAVEIVDGWIDAPAAWIPEANATTWTILRRLVERYGLTRNLVPDGQLAALALQYGVALASADTDFARFTELTWINPLS